MRCPARSNRTRSCKEWRKAVSKAPRETCSAESTACEYSATACRSEESTCSQAGVGPCSGAGCSEVPAAPATSPPVREAGGGRGERAGTPRAPGEGISVPVSAGHAWPPALKCEPASSRAAAPVFGAVCGRPPVHRAARVTGSDAVRNPWSGRGESSVPASGLHSRDADVGHVEAAGPPDATGREAPSPGEIGLPGRPVADGELASQRASALASGSAGDGPSAR